MSDLVALKGAVAAKEPPPPSLYQGLESLQFALAGVEKTLAIVAERVRGPSAIGSGSFGQAAGPPIGTLGRAVFDLTSAAERVRELSEELAARV